MVYFYITLIIIIILIVSIRVFFALAPQVGDGGKKRPPINANDLSYYKNGFYHNLTRTRFTTPNPALLYKFLFSNNREPKYLIHNKLVNKELYNFSNHQPLITWLGHSSILLRIDGTNILIDPVFSARASMFPFIGPKAFKKDSEIRLEDLPPIDIVLISHDHYDHLDYKVIKKLAPNVSKIYTHHGVGAHLEKWGIEPERIIEMLWWQQETVIKGMTLTSVPMRHFSGRGPTDRNTTLWGGFAIKGVAHNILFSADSGYWEGFKEIGNKLGPFDLAFLECGQYNEAWHDIHMMPEETAQAGADVKATNVIPIHWGKFPLSLHSWDEPIERFMAAENQYDYTTRLPEIGATYAIDDIPTIEWWNNIQ
ncbi:MAG: MBL fold metallo-hydrolase [Bacteroidota bacterium]